MLKLKKHLYFFVCLIVLIACNKPNKDDEETITQTSIDNTNNKINLPDTLVPFKPLVSFSDFKTIGKHHALKAPLQWSSNINAKRFEKRIKDAYQAKAPNFAGHYIFFDWGCGLSCQSSMLIDWNTGELYDGVNASLGYDYKVNSRMLIINPPDSAGYDGNCIYCKPDVYIFNDHLKRFEKYQIKK